MPHDPRPNRPRPLPALLLMLMLALWPAWAAAGTVRIKDIVTVEGVRDNLLVGYGLVVGLNGTGDSLNNSPFTQASLTGMLERLGVNVRGAQLKTRNVAAVMVTAVLPPFSRQGSRIDVSVAALGDAKDLLGGALLVTPLVGADGEVYAVAQGSVATAAVSARGQAASVSRGVPTSARIADGALVEREIPFTLAGMPTLTLALRNPDFTTATRIAAAINRRLGEGSAHARDPAGVVVTVPKSHAGDPVRLITEIESLPVEPDQIARVLIDEASGIIVMGDQVRLSTVAIAQGNLTIRITETPQVSQPAPLSNGETTEVPRTQIEIDDDVEKKIAVLPEAVTLRDLVEGLNQLGVGPRDIISILQAIKAAGALQAEIDVR